MILMSIMDWLHSIINSGYFGGLNFVIVNDNVPGKVTNRDYGIRGIQALLFNPIYRWVYTTAATVKIGSMHMDYQRFPRYLLGSHSCRVGQPIVRMNDIEFVIFSNLRCNQTVIINFLIKVCPVFP